MDEYFYFNVSFFYFNESFFYFNDSFFYSNESFFDNGTEFSFVDWTLDSGLNGPAIAFIIALHLVLALPANLFVVIYSLCHHQDFKKGAVILLFCLAVSNLIMTFLYMPFVIVAAAAEEWIIGGSDNTRHVLCHIHGFIYEYSITVTNHILVVISIERFFYIVKAHLHSKIMSWKAVAAIMVAVGILTIFWCSFPYYGVGTYDWSISSAGCLSFILHDSLALSIVFILYSIILLTIILTSTLWTFIFTRNFLKKSTRMRQITQPSDKEKHEYNHRVRNLAGIFGALLAVNIFSWIAYVFPPVFYGLIGDHVSKVPLEIDTVLFIFSFSNTVANPIIQIYFRREMRNVLVKFCRKRGNKVHSTAQESASSKHNRDAKNKNRVVMDMDYSSANYSYGPLGRAGTSDEKYNLIMTTL